ncbi:MAG: hypothetical protein MUO40_03195 [Anaerolineaceae bacterium]|nr:hypothetical protein [Anaerolineaceae bacterium]
MTANYYLGVDIGNTKSHALVSDSEGKVVSFAKAGHGNHERLGFEGYARVIQELIMDVLQKSALEPGDLSGSGFGIAGYDWPSQYTPLMNAIKTFDLGGETVMVNDTLIGLAAGAPKGWGIGLVAGTGSNCWGMTECGILGRMTGLSHLMDEGGGASHIVLWAVQAIGRAWTKRGPRTLLTETFMNRFNEQEEVVLLERLSQQESWVDPSLAPLVIETARQGDEAALEVIAHAVESLSSMCWGVARQLDLLEKQVDVVLIGSVFNAGDIIIDPLREAIKKEIPGANLIKLDTPPVVGGVLMAMKSAGAELSGDALLALKQAARQVADEHD